MQTHDYYNNHSQKIQPQPQPQTKNTAKIQASTSKKEKKTEKPSFFAGFCELDVLISTHPWGVAPACTSKIARFRFQPIILKYLNKNRLFAPIVSGLTVEFHSSNFFLNITTLSLFGLVFQAYDKEGTTTSSQTTSIQTV